MQRHRRSERERRHIDQLLGKRVDGLVVTARRADRRAPVEPPVRGLPVIYVFSRVESSDALCLLPDDEGGAGLASEHLLELGRRRIAHITGPEQFEAVRLRRARLSRGAADGRRQAARGPIGPAHGRKPGAARPSAKMFDGSRAAPDALFCGNDQIARGALDALRERGRSGARDVAIVGFDNWDVMAEATAARSPAST